MFSGLPDIKMKAENKANIKVPIKLMFAVCIYFILPIAHS